jgi:hypothetical protein
VVVYSVLMSFVTVTRHFHPRTHAVDLALYDQMVWAIANVGAPWSTLPDLHGWGDHVTIILYLMAPLLEWRPERDGARVLFRSRTGATQTFSLVEARGSLLLLRRGG